MLSKNPAPACRPPREVPPGKKLIFRPWITLANGRRLYASSVGKRAFPIFVAE
jgi:hypothetical protein